MLRPPPPPPLEASGVASWLDELPLQSPLEVRHGDGWWSVVLTAHADAGGQYTVTYVPSGQEHRVRDHALRPFWMWRTAPARPAAAAAAADSASADGGLGSWLRGAPAAGSAEAETAEHSRIGLPGAPPWAASCFDVGAQVRVVPTRPVRALHAACARRTRPRPRASG